MPNGSRQVACLTRADVRQATQKSALCLICPWRPGVELRPHGITYGQYRPRVRGGDGKDIVWYGVFLTNCFATAFGPVLFPQPEEEEGEEGEEEGDEAGQ
jgi:hypothetical protein